MTSLTFLLCQDDRWFCGVHTNAVEMRLLQYRLPPPDAAGARPKSGSGPTKSRVSQDDAAKDARAAGAAKAVLKHFDSEGVPLKAGEENGGQRKQSDVYFGFDPGAER